MNITNSITPSVVILASDFIQHVFLIVLVGVAFAEYLDAVLALSKAPPNEFVEIMHYAKKARFSLIIIAMATAWFIGEYFFATSSFFYHALIRWPLVLGILVAFVVFIMRADTSLSLRRIGITFVSLLSLFIVLDIMNYIYHSAFLSVTLAFERVATMLAFFFTFLMYFATHKPNNIYYRK